MGRKLSAAMVALALGGCQEINIYDVPRSVGKGDAPSLDTPVQTDVIVQRTKPSVDILWVVDDSCSMIEEQTKLANNFDRFIAFFLDSGLEWHIGVVSTDTDDPSKDGILRSAGGFNYLTPEVPNPQAVFSQMVRMGTNGSGTERGLQAAWHALNMPTPRIQNANAGFYRDDATLHIVVISDENDQSGNNPNPNEFANFLSTIKSDDDTAVTFSSIVSPNPPNCAGGLDASYGSRYVQVTNAVGGLLESICTADWSPILEELGLQAAGLRKEYFLTQVPVPGTVTVWVEDGDVTFDGIDIEKMPDGPTINQVCDRRGLQNCFLYEYDVRRNAVYMDDFLPGPLARVNIRYELLSEQQPEDTDTDVPE